METYVANSDLAPIAEKIYSGVRLTFDDGVTLYRSNDILTLGHLANHVREEKNGDAAFYILNRHINPTNVCFVDCQLCAFARKVGEDGGWTMSIDEVIQAAARGYTEAVREFHIVGGLHPYLPFQYYVDVLRALRYHFPQVHLKAFTMVEIDFLADLAGKSLYETIEILKHAGLDSVPGGGAEILAKRVRDLICTKKISGERWLEVARAVHECGVRSNATMLYGHVETAEERVDHLVRLRELQDETGGFMAFIPLAFHPENTQLSHLPWTTGYDDLKNIAVARLMLDNVDHIKAYWIMMGPKLAQVALRFGADDLDGTVVEEKIYHMAGGQTPQGLTRAEIENLIRQAGRIPVERDSVYTPVGQSVASPVG
jgi:aminodeoxyfutalosine synthase